MILITIFNHNGALLMLYMVVLNVIALVAVAPQYSRNSSRGMGLFGLAVLTFLMSLMPIQSGDFIYYGGILQTGVNFGHFEEVYQILWILNPDYLAWRMVVWGLCVILLVLNIRLLKLNSKFAAFIFIITQFFYFGTMRNMLGFMLMFVGVTLIFIPKKIIKKSFYIVLGALCLWGCTFLHRSMWMYVLLLVCGLIPWNKFSLRLSILGFPIFWISVFAMSAFFLSTFGDSETQQHANYYTDGERTSTFLQTFMELLKNGAYLYLLYRILQSYSSRNIKFPFIYKFLTGYSYVLIYIGFLFLGQKNGGWLFSRFTEAGEIALMWVIMWYFHKIPRDKNIKIAFSVFVIFIIYRILYICFRAPGEFIDKANLITL